MAKINRVITINGEKKWIHAKTEQDYAEKLRGIFLAECSQKQGSHQFKAYALNWFELYSKPNVSSVTKETYKRQLDRHIFPILGEKTVERITPDDIQILFNGMDCAKSTKQKVKTVLNMIFESAIEDDIISKNPLRSRKVRIEGKPSTFTKEYSVEQMRYLVEHLDDILNESDKAYLAIQALHPLRLEEVLGLQWQDVNLENRNIHICRVVTHPTRNQPEIKETKTEASERIIGLSSIAARYLAPGRPYEFIFGGVKPYTYEKVKKMCQRIQRDTGFEEKITPIRFRTTVLTDIYDQTKDVKLAQASAGHTTSAMTLKYYIKGRQGVDKAISAIDSVYGFAEKLPGENP